MMHGAICVQCTAQQVLSAGTMHSTSDSVSTGYLSVQLLVC